MKKIIFFVAALSVSFQMLIAQNEVDALRYSYVTGGTARYTSLGGAFGALGGDITCLSTNPAGMAVFQQSDFSITPSFEYINSEASFMSSTTTDFDYNFNINSFGYVGTSKFNKESSSLKNINFGIGYTRLNNFHQNTLINGDNTNNSMTDWFANRANGTHFSQLQNVDNFYSSLAWETYLINQVSLTDTMNYISVYNGVYGQNTSHAISRDGYLGEFDISLSANFNHLLYLGATFGIQPLRFEQTIFHSEVDSDDAIADFNSFNYTEHLYTHGTGLNFKFGLLARPVDWVRIGAAIHSPTFYNLSDEYSTEITSNFVNPDYSRTWYSSAGYYDYQLTSPFKAIGSLAFVIQKYGLISFEYEFVDYSLARLRAYDYTFIDENQAIQTEYKSTGNIKGGLEYRLGQLSLRAGAAYFGSPYVKGHINEGSYQMMYSGGLGFRGKSLYFDVAYAYITGNEGYLLYESSDPVLTSPVSDISKNSNRILATIGVKF